MHFHPEMAWVFQFITANSLLVNVVDEIPPKLENICRMVTAQSRCGSVHSVVDPN